MINSLILYSRRVLSLPCLAVAIASVGANVAAMEPSKPPQQAGPQAQVLLPPQPQSQRQPRPQTQSTARPKAQPPTLAKDAALTAPVDQPVIGAPVPIISLQLSPNDGLLSSALALFATKHGWTVSWELDRDFPIDFPARFEGSFLNIIEQVATALQSSETPIRVKAYHGNHVLRVMAATQ